MYFYFYQTHTHTHTHRTIHNKMYFFFQVFGKTMENLRNRVNIELITSKKIARKRFARPSFKRCKIFNENLIAIHCMKENLILSRPIQVGFAILELSKCHMYNFHYNVWLPKFPESKLLFTDTDSLAYSVKNADVYGEMQKMKQVFDFSGYPTTHPLYSTDNMKAGVFKDELKGNIMEKFIGLRPKLYCYTEIVNKDNKETKKEKLTAKGVKKLVKEQKLSFADYEICLQTCKPKTVEFNYIRSDHHQLYTYSTSKIGLSMNDDKRWICADGVHTLAHGHYLTKTL